MLLEVQKKDPEDLRILDDLMIATFSQQRREIIGDEPLYGHGEMACVVS